MRNCTEVLPLSLETPRELERQAGVSLPCRTSSGGDAGTRLRSCNSSGARDPSVCGSALTTAQPLHVWGPAQLRSVSKQSWLVRLRGLHEWAGCPTETHGRESWADSPDHLGHFCTGCDCGQERNHLALLSVCSTGSPGVKRSPVCFQPLNQ